LNLELELCACAAGAFVIQKRTMKGDHLGEFEELVVLTVHGLDGDAYGVSIQQRLEEETTRRVSLGAVYAALDRLEVKGLVRSQIAAGTPVRGGRSRRLFRVTVEGLRVLEALKRIRERLYRAAATRLARGGA
jgi:PadR family transcriptional regulator, regulatory protein PadR